jgi:hypothetical protein
MIVHHDRWVLRAFSGDRVVLVGPVSRPFFCPVVLVRKTLRVSSWIPINARCLLMLNELLHKEGLTASKLDQNSRSHLTSAALQLKSGIGKSSRFGDSHGFSCFNRGCRQNG